jgi:hypothetical protein
LAICDDADYFQLSPQLGAVFISADCGDIFVTATLTDLPRALITYL